MVLPSCPRTGTSVSGTISGTAPSPRACLRSLPPVLAAPFAEVPSPNPIGSPSGESHTPSVPSSCSRPLSTADGSNTWAHTQLPGLPTLSANQNRSMEHEISPQQENMPPYPRFSAAVFALGSTPSSRLLQGSLVSAWKSSHPSRLALSQHGGENRMIWVQANASQCCHTKHHLHVLHGDAVFPLRSGR